MPARPQPTGAVLVAEDLHLKLGRATLLEGVSLEVNPGELVGLIGANGAGKTVLFDCLCGLVKPSAGRVRLGGADVTRAPAFWRTWHGLGRTFQEGRLFAGMSVDANVALGACVRAGGFVSDALSLPWSMRGRAESLRRAREVLALVGGAGLGGREVAGLTGAERRRVEIARALAGRPRVLLLDEPAAGLEPGALDLRSLLPEIRDATGAGILLVEHDPRLVFSTCDFVYALDAGSVIAAGTPADVREHPQLRRAYLGVA